MLKHRKNGGSIANSFSTSETPKNGILHNNGKSRRDETRRDEMRGESFVSNLTGLISDELNKIQGCPTTEFKDNDLNCVVG